MRNVDLFLVCCLWLWGCWGCRKSGNPSHPVPVTDTTAVSTPAGQDARNYLSGTTIHESPYIDQPYLAVFPDKWVCVYTEGPGIEGAAGEHIASSVSTDHGISWTDAPDVEAAGTNAAFYAVPFVSQSGRLYVIYGYNETGILIDDRTDQVGRFCFRYSDDEGVTWSDRFYINMPATAFDLANQFGGKYQEFWNICKPVRANGQLFLSFTKASGHYGPTYLSGGAVMVCRNIDSETDPSKLDWQFLPSGGSIIRNPALGPVQEEFNLVQLSDGSFYSVNRTGDGFVSTCVSKDAGQSWSLPVPLTDASGRTMKNPRACPRLFKCANGKYLLWYHDNGAKDDHNRNPVWISGGTENGNGISWSQPEILLYAHIDTIRFSYPDLIEYNGEYFLTETQKTTAKIHHLDKSLINGLWAPGAAAQNITTGLAYNHPAAPFPDALLSVSPLQTGGGLTIMITTKLSSDPQGTVLLNLSAPDSLAEKFQLFVTGSQTLKLRLTQNGEEPFDVQTPPLSGDSLHRIAFVLDGQAKIASVMADGVLYDGGADALFGWRRMSNVAGRSDEYKLSVTAKSQTQITHLRVWHRYLTNSELISAGSGQ